MPELYQMENFLFPKTNEISFSFILLPCCLTKNFKFVYLFDMQKHKRTSWKNVILGFHGMWKHLFDRVILTAMF